MVTVSKFGTKLHVLIIRPCDLGSVLQEVVVVRGAAPYPTPYRARALCSLSWCELLMLEVMLVKKHLTRTLTSGVDVSVSQDGFIWV